MKKQARLGGERPGEEGEDEEGLPGDDASEEGEGGAQRDERVPQPRRHRHLSPLRSARRRREGEQACFGGAEGCSVRDFAQLCHKG